MKYLLIKNNGIIQAEALHLMGASTKRNDETKIGMFGTGNKYALSYFLRNNYDIRLFSGIDEIKITLEKKDFRGQQFDVIYINGERTSLTTDMGTQWKLWQAIRELYCNAIDEGTCLMYIVETVKPNKDETHFYIPMNEELEEFMADFDKYFAFNKTVVYQNPIGKILAKVNNTANFYRKGIRCFDHWLNSIFDYDFHDLEINESRLASHSGLLEEKMWQLLLSCDNIEIIKRLFQHLEEGQIVEGNISDYCILPKTPSPEILAYLKTIEIMPMGLSGLLTTEERARCIIVPTRLFSYLRDFLDDENVAEKVRMGKGGTFYREIEPTNLHTATINRAMEFFKETRLEIPYPIKVGMFDKKDIFGLADNETIVLSDLGIERGVHETVNTVMEEFLHIKYKVQDCTRQFQTASINEFINYMKREHSFII
jgi:hypothetical protein